MKKILYIILPFLFFPAFAFASVHYTRSPAGTNITSPVHISVSFDDFSDFPVEVFDPLQLPVKYWSVEIGGDSRNPSTACLPITTKSVSQDVQVPVGYVSSVVRLNYGNNEDPNCNGESSYFFEGNDADTIFTITSPYNSGVLFGTHYSQSGSDGMATTGVGMLAAVGAVSTNAFNSLFPYLMLSAGVFLGFYIIESLSITIGNRFREAKEKIDPEQANWTGKGVMDKEYRQFRKKERSKIKRNIE